MPRTVIKEQILWDSLKHSYGAARSLPISAKKEPVPGSGTGSGFMLDGSEAEVEKAKGVQNRHEDSTENIEDRVEHSCFPPFLNNTLVNVNIT